MNWTELSDERLRQEIARLRSVAYDANRERQYAEDELSARKYGLPIGGLVEIGGVTYERVWSEWGLKLRKVGGKAGRYAYSWAKWKAGEAETPW